MSLATRLAALATRVAEETVLRGLPAGGTTGQLPFKASGTDYDTDWLDAADGVFAGFPVSASPAFTVPYVTEDGQWFVGILPLDSIDLTTLAGIVTAIPRTIEVKTGAYTINSGDGGVYIRMNATGAVNVTVPAGLGLGFTVDVFNASANPITFVASGVTFANAVGLKLAQNQGATLVYQASNVVDIVGGLSA